MGNALGGKKRRTAKVMKLDGTTMRLKLPAQVGDVLQDHPEHTLLEAEEVKRLGVRAQRLEPAQAIKPGKLYFLVEIPRLQDRRVPRRAWSGAIQMSAKDRLESLMLSRRSASDLTLFKPSSVETVGEGGVRIRMRLPKAQVTKLVEESSDSCEAAERIMALCVANGAETSGGSTLEERPKEAISVVRVYDVVIWSLTNSLMQLLPKETKERGKIMNVCHQLRVPDPPGKFTSLCMDWTYAKNLQPAVLMMIAAISAMPELKKS
ncbi:hypothetical protein COCNU_03G010230 [Cocos nucifera]|uniref:Uncharacterized protein n=1 Tax=Cocos nucifera TaxID=13894 RepID=A0A8K0MYZ6_COCNU|nr:hypothetical protein COCNU_03G010230 [Cocos nucifera]